MFKEETMPEPTTTTAAATGAFKLAAATGLAVPLVAALVMIMSHPKSKREWGCALLATVASSIFSGAFLVQYFDIAAWLQSGLVGIAAIAGIIFAAGLPGWVIVRAFFRYAERNKDKGLLDLIKEIRGAFSSDQK